MSQSKTAGGQAKPKNIVTWEDIDTWSCRKKKDWLVGLFPEELKGISERLIDESGLDHNDLMIPTLVLYSVLAQKFYKEPKVYKELDALRREVRSVKELLTNPRPQAKTPKAQTANANVRRILAESGEVKAQVTKLFQENKELKLQNEEILKALQVMINKPSMLSPSWEWITKKITLFKQWIKQ